MIARPTEIAAAIAFVLAPSEPPTDKGSSALREVAAALPTRDFLGMA